MKPIAPIALILTICIAAGSAMAFPNMCNLVPVCVAAKPVTTPAIRIHTPAIRGSHA